MAAFPALGKCKCASAEDLRLVHHKSSHFLPSAEAESVRDECVAEGLVVAVIAIVLSAPVLMLTGVLY